LLVAALESLALDFDIVYVLVAINMVSKKVVRGILAGVDLSNLKKEVNTKQPYFYAGGPVLVR
jgi:hypothetical protein